jgi:dihydrofolate synthase / folylpolyglutamate synthase
MITLKRTRILFIIATISLAVFIVSSHLKYLAISTPSTHTFHVQGFRSTTIAFGDTYRMYNILRTSSKEIRPLLSPSITYLLFKVSNNNNLAVQYHHRHQNWLNTIYKHSSGLIRTRRFSSTIDRIMNDELVNNPNNRTNGISDVSSAHDCHGAMSSVATTSSSSPVKHYTEYELWVRRLYATNMFHPVKLGLDNMIQLYKAIGNTLDDICVVHIAGTNGKGSVALKIAKTLQYNNMKVGLFCSPHVSSFRERMQINDRLISEDEVVRLLPEIYQLCKIHDIPATFFEITTVLAFRYFAIHNVDVVVLETGLGGRLDATNVLQNPALAVITSIGLEHTRILGNTIELIALEKGGIIKKDRPVLVGPNVPHDVLQKCAQEKGASQYYTCDNVLGKVDDPNDDHKIDYDLENARIAKAAIKLLQQSSIFNKLSTTTISDDVIERGTSHRPPCRFEVVRYKHKNHKSIQVILDVAHNPPAMEYLAYKLHTTYPNRKFHLVVGMSSDKDMSLCSKLLKQIVFNDVSRIYLVEAAHPRAAKLEDMWKADPELQLHAQYDINNRSVTNQISSNVRNSI